MHEARCFKVLKRCGSIGILFGFMPQHFVDGNVGFSCTVPDGNGLIAWAVKPESLLLNASLGVNTLSYSTSLAFTIPIRQIATEGLHVLFRNGPQLHTISVASRAVSLSHILRS